MFAALLRLWLTENREIELVHKLSKGGKGSFSLPGQRGSALTLTELASQPLPQDKFGAAEASFEPQAEELTEEDQIVLKRWKERDKEFDAQVAQIGDAIDRIGKSCSRQAQRILRSKAIQSVSLA